MANVWRTLFSSSDPISQSARLLDGLRPLIEALAEGPEQRIHQQPRLAEALLEWQLPGWRVSEVISDHNDFCYRQAIERALEVLRDTGWGEPPVRFCVIVMGSGARHESLLHPDQDNGLILDDYPAEHHTEIDAWFLHFAEHFTATLDAAGIPFCRGDVMASRPLWRKPISEWQEQMRLWMSTRRVKLVQMCNILFDFAPVYGEVELALRLKAWIQQLLPQSGLFLHEMSELMDEAPVALDRFDRLQGDGREAPHPDAINLKRQGLLPLTSALRLCSLLQGVDAVSSRDRLEALHDAGALTDDEHWRLVTAFERLQSRLLVTQVEAYRQGRVPDNWVDTRRLCDGEKRELQWDLQQVKLFQRKVRQIRY